MFVQISDRNQNTMNRFKSVIYLIAILVVCNCMKYANAKNITSSDFLNRQRRFSSETSAVSKNHFLSF